MKTLLSELRASLAATLVFTVVLCAAYPLAVWAAAQGLFPDQANGSLVTDAGGAIRGSRLLAQAFTQERYFHPRPSLAGAGYDAANSSGSNLGPTSRKLAEIVRADLAAYRTENALPADAPVPADAVTHSGSGLDPHISAANAELQAPRVARARGLPLARVQALVAAHTEPPQLRLFGETGVNVLTLNRALDAEPPAR